RGELAPSALLLIGQPPRLSHTSSIIRSRPARALPRAAGGARRQCAAETPAPVPATRSHEPASGRKGRCGRARDLPAARAGPGAAEAFHDHHRVVSTPHIDPKAVFRSIRPSDRQASREQVVSPGDFVVEDYGRKLFPLSLVDLVLRGDPPQDLDDFLAQPESDGQRSWLSGVEALNDAVARRDAQNGHEVDPGQLDRDHVVLLLDRIVVLPRLYALLLAIALLALLHPVHE